MSPANMVTLVALLAVICIQFVQVHADVADIVVLVDSSDSKRSRDFQTEKAFLEDFATKVFLNNNQLSLFTFGQQVDPQFNLNSFNTLTPVLNAIRYVWYSTGNGAPASAINQTVYSGFSVQSGNRECVPNVLVVLTHTGILSADVIRLTRVLNEFIIRTFIIDMTKNPDTSLFVKLTNASTRVIPVDNFDSLKTSVDTLVTRMNNDLPRTGCGQLGSWEAWTRCSVSCGHGLKFRVRRCQKVEETDKDCNAELSEDQTCNQPICTVKLDGGWSNWSNWGKCSKTCNNGTQTRTRRCSEPIPINGGKKCVGTDLQTRQCSTWTCPDCSRKCPAGGRLSADCETCLCQNVALYGRAIDTTNTPVKKARIFLKSSRNRPICTSNDLGYFSASGVCLMNEEIVIEAVGYSTEHYTPHSVNVSHWTVNATLLKYIHPLFKTQPHDKVRMVGQSLTLCCDAVGVPAPTKYTWLKDGNELGNGTDGQLVLSNVQERDGGLYVCSVETDAGVSRSDEAEVIVDAHKDDTCSSPVSKIEALPNGCYVTNSLNQDTTVDVQTCSKATCMKRSLQDNGTCTDWWPSHCCDVDQIEKINVTCENYSYETTRVTSCKCTLCIVKTVISGRAFGKKNGKKFPLQLGEIRYNGRFGANTNMAGYFRFQVEKGTKRAVLTLHDGIFKKFLDSTRIFELSEGTEMVVNIVLPFKPDPIPFTPSIGSDIQIGGDGKGLPPAGTISIPGNSLIDTDGNPYEGSQGAKAHVHFMDPRKAEDIETADGEFVYQTLDGKRMPLRTFGMFHVEIVDNHGSELRLNQPLSFDLDAAQFNFTSDDKGDPDVDLWTWDPNKGIWIEQNKMKFASASGSGRRKLLANVLTGTMPPASTPLMNPVDIITSTSRTIVGYRGNCDNRVPIYRDVTTRTPVVKKGACVVSISVYEDLTLAQKAPKGKISVTAFTKEKNGNSYLGKKTDTIDKNGHICLDIFCDEIVYIYAENAAGERLFPAKHTLPLGYPLINNTVREVSFESRNFGTAYDCAFDVRPEVQNGPCTGPLFTYADRLKCPRHNSDASFMFKFAPFTRDPVFTSTVGDKNTYDKKLSWYPVPPSSNTFRSCFLKLSIKVQDNLDNFDMRVIGVSYLEKNKGEQFGTYNVGPKPDPDSPDTAQRGACIEFRCPGYIKDGSKEYFDKPTVVAVNINTGNKNLKCSIVEVRPGLNVVRNANGMGFLFTAASGNNYGKSYGVYIGDKQASEVNDFCHSGYIYGPNVDGLMKPNKGYAVKMFCNE